MNSIKNFFTDETGLELSEYAIATALISLAVSAAMTSLGNKIGGAINSLNNKITT